MNIFDYLDDAGVYRRIEGLDGVRSRSFCSTFTSSSSCKAIAPFSGEFLRAFFVGELKMSRVGERVGDPSYLLPEPLSDLFL